MFGREEFKPIYEGITLGIEALLFFVGASRWVSAASA